MTYLPIENYGIIGDMHTAALVGINGSIDWFCYPDFDSPSIFAAILDDRRGGRFQIDSMCQDVSRRQMYWPDTNVLITRFLAEEGVGEVQDFMPLASAISGARPRTVVRRVRVARGAMRFRLVCQPAFDYGRQQPKIEITREGAIFAGERLRLRLCGPVPLRVEGDRITAEFELAAGESATFALGDADDDVSEQKLSESDGEQEFEETVQFWRRWLSQCTYAGRWREIVHRSALTLKLLTYEPTGAIVAAPTCSLPNRIGGPRNWDFRYTWIRDAAFSLYGLMRLGFTREAAAFMGFLDKCYQYDAEIGPLQVVYGIRGEREPVEQTLDHLEGYRGSAPVRIGNAAYHSSQLDIYGELLDSVYLYNKYGSWIGHNVWSHVRRLVDWVCDHWDQPDHGIWEVRSEKKHFVYSKVMCWVAIDRGLRIAQKRSLPADEARWREARNAIYEQVMERGWSDRQGTFVQSYGSDCLDGAALVMPLVFFTAPDEPKMLKTLDAIMRRPAEGGLTTDGLVFRFDPREPCGDGIEGEEGTFNMCSFWLVEALTRASRSDPRRLERARLLFEHMLGYANHVGIYSEQTGTSGQALGNTPQAFTHLALISAATNLDEALGSSAV